MDISLATEDDVRDEVADAVIDQPFTLDQVISFFRTAKKLYRKNYLYINHEDEDSVCFAEQHYGTGRAFELNLANIPHIARWKEELPGQIGRSLSPEDVEQLIDLGITIREI